MKNFNFAGPLVAIIAALLAWGVCTFVGPCPVMEHHHPMACFWASRSIFGLASLTTLLAFFHIFMKCPKFRLGLDFALVGLSILTMLTPNVIINLCADNAMRCQEIMAPATLVASILTLVISFIDLFVQFKHAKAEGKCEVKVNK